jgi:hypothetical protein
MSIKTDTKKEEIKKGALKIEKIIDFLQLLVKTQLINAEFNKLTVKEIINSDQKSHMVELLKKNDEFVEQLKKVSTLLDDSDRFLGFGLI